MLFLLAYRNFHVSAMDGSPPPPDDETAAGAGSRGGGGGDGGGGSVRRPMNAFLIFCKRHRYFSVCCRFLTSSANFAKVKLARKI